MRSFFANIYRLGVKELWSLVRDPMMLILIVYVFTVSIYVAATAMPESLHNAPIAIVDEDGSPLSARIVSSFYPPRFMTPRMISLAEGEDAVAEERRLLYVGVTRAREHLELSWARARTPGGRASRRRSRFLRGVWPGGRAASRRPTRPACRCRTRCSPTR